jgi:hypothetical protein
MSKVGPKLDFGRCEVTISAVDEDDIVLASPKNT